MKIIDEYLNRKSIRQKIDSVSPDQYEGLRQLVEYHGDYVFNRTKSPLSIRTINDTIPLMIRNGVHDYVNNLSAIGSVVRNSLEHYILLYGDNANTAWEKRNKLSIQNEETYILRHGEVEGKRIWDAGKQKRSDRNTLVGYCERFGDEVGLEKYTKMAERQRYTNTVEYYIEKYGEDQGPVLYRERYPSDYDLDEYKDYKKMVYKMSNIVYNNNIDVINPDNHTRTRMGVENGWQLDHIKPVTECFSKGISIAEASSIENLRMLPWKENLMRNFDK